jgi:signal transduction histidine kinase
MNSTTLHSRGHGIKPRKRTMDAKRCARARHDVDDERERVRAALHGGLGQLLTSISFLASTLRQKLAARKLPEATDAAEIISLTGRAISETQAIVTDSDSRARLRAHR